MCKELEPEKMNLKTNKEKWKAELD